MVGFQETLSHFIPTKKTLTLHSVSNGSKQVVRAKSFQSCPTLCNRMDCSLPSSSVHEILQARILEWIAMPSSKGSSQPRDRICISYISGIGRQVLYHQHHLGNSSKFLKQKSWDNTGENYEEERHMLCFLLCYLKIPFG